MREREGKRREKGEGEGPAPQIFWSRTTPDVLDPQADAARHFEGRHGSIFTARCYASAVLAMALCLSVRPSVCLSVRHKSVFY